MSIVQLELRDLGEFIVTKRESKGSEDVAKQRPNLLVLVGSASSEDVKLHGETEDDHSKEDEEHDEVSDDVSDHGDDVTEAGDDSELLNSLHHGSPDHKHHHELGDDGPSADIQLAVDGGVASDDVDVVSRIVGKVRDEAFL